MPLITTSPKLHHTKTEITPTDIWIFLSKARWFVVGGIIFGLVIVTIYLIITPPIYISKVTIQVTPSFKDQISASLISSEDLAERLKFDQALPQITQTMNVPAGDSKIYLIEEALNAATPTRAGVFLNLNTKGSTPENAKKLAGELSNAIIKYINNVNQPRIIYLQKSLSTYKSKFTSGINQIDLQNKILDLELAIGYALEFGPSIVNGPSLSLKPISPNKKSAIILALILGAITGCVTYYLRGLLSKKE